MALERAKSRLTNTQGHDMKAMAGIAVCLPEEHCYPEFGKEQSNS